MFKSSYSTKYLPTVNYLTSLDKYSIFSLVFIYLCLAWYGIAAFLVGVYNNNIVLTIDKIILVLFLLLYFVVHVMFIMWLRTAYLIRNSMVDRDEEFWLDEKKCAEERIHSSFANNSHQISPSLIHNLETHKHSLAGHAMTSNSSGNIPRSFLKRDSLFGTINNIDKIGYYQNRNSRPTISDNFRQLFNIQKPKKSSSLDNDFSKVIPNI